MDTQYKCNMPDILAALGVVQLQRYEKILERRHELIRVYNEEFKDLPIQVLNHCDENHRSSGHLYFVRFIGKDDEYRNKFYNMMAENGVMCNVHFKPLPMLSAYKKRGFKISDIRIPIICIKISLHFRSIQPCRTMTHGMLLNF